MLITDAGERPQCSLAAPSNCQCGHCAVATQRQRRFGFAITGAVGLLAAVTLLDKFGPAHSGLVLGPIGAIALIALARRYGLSWDDLGLGRRSWRKGAAYAAG